eukprot:TRINITY_DN56651_c0_g1_i1.p1 TRINITY_DN56651_c0_g1~~TRINITY_DN56651_c0_g1_i1.p1  ORF type:complete len:608 (-),score=170.52 TRINITY_DN56651_c0_g1_i1:151-1920(-)
MALSPGSDSSEQRGLMNCHFSLNQSALHNVIRPLVAEMVQEVQHGERLQLLEASLSRLQHEVEAKAEARALQEQSTAMQKLALEMQHKADKKAQMELQTGLARVESSLGLKIERAALDEVIAALQGLSQTVGQKADLGYVNKTNVTVQKLAERVSKAEKSLSELALATSTLESHKLPSVVQRTRDVLDRTVASVKKLEASVATRAEQQQLDEVVYFAQNLETTLHTKASTQAMMELQVEARDLRRELALKADQATLEGRCGELHRMSSQIVTKANDQDVREVATVLKSVQQELARKADQHALNDARSKLQTLEVVVSSKAEVHDVGELSSSLRSLKDGLQQKADVHVVSDLERGLQHVRGEVGQKAESRHIDELSLGVGQLKELAARKADHEPFAQRLDDLEQHAKRTLELLLTKADNCRVDEAEATIRALGARAQAASSPLQGSLGRLTGHAATAPGGVGLGVKVLSGSGSALAVSASASTIDAAADVAGGGAPVLDGKDDGDASSMLPTLEGGASPSGTLASGGSFSPVASMSPPANGHSARRSPSTRGPASPELRRGGNAAGAGPSGSASARRLYGRGPAASAGRS